METPTKSMCIEVFLTLAALLAFSPKTLGIDNSDDSEDWQISFHYGDSCERLEFLPEEAIISLVRSEFADNFRRFCYVDMPAVCSDFSVYLYDLGYLAAGEGDFCDFRPLSRKGRTTGDYEIFHGVPAPDFHWR